MIKCRDRRRASRISPSGNNDGSAGTAQFGQIADGSHANLQPAALAPNDWTIEVHAVSPRVTFSCPILKDRVAFTESIEYRHKRNQLYSLPALQSDTKSETLDSYTQIDLNIRKKQIATASFAIFPQKLDYYGLNTFTP